MQRRPVGAELFLADGQTDIQTNMAKLRVAFHSFVEAPKNWGNIRIKWRFLDSDTCYYVSDFK